MNALYPAGYFVAHDYENDPRRARAKEQEAQRILARLAPGFVGRALDVGCGLGDFLAEHFPGWVCHGVEVSEYAAEQARRRGLNVVGSVDELSGEFDLIVWRGTFQHLDEPLHALKCCKELLRRGGLMAFLATPNSNSLVYKLFGVLPALDPPRNWIVPSDSMLVNILTHLGMRTEVIYPYWSTPYARPLKDAICFAGRLLGVRANFAWPGNMMELYAWHA